MSLRQQIPSSPPQRGFHHSVNVRTVLMLILTVTLTLTANGRFVVNQSSESGVEGQVYHEPPPPQWGSALRPSSVSSTSA